MLVSPPVNGNVATPYAQATAGLQKWILADDAWQMAYVVNSGLNIGIPYSVKNYPAAINPAPGGCRHLTGHVDGNGIVTIYATTSTISASGDQGADPNQLVKVQDILGAKTPSEINHFKVIRAAKSGEVFRGVDWAPLESGQDNQN